MGSVSAEIAALEARVEAADGRVFSTRDLGGVPGFVFVPEPWPLAIDGPPAAPDPGPWIEAAAADASPRRRALALLATRTNPGGAPGPQFEAAAGDPTPAGRFPRPCLTRTRRAHYPVAWVPLSLAEVHALAAGRAPVPPPAAPAPPETALAAALSRGLAAVARLLLDGSDAGRAAALAERLPALIGPGLGELAAALWARRARVPGDPARALLALAAASADELAAPAILETALAELDPCLAPALVRALAEGSLKARSETLVLHAARAPAAAVALLESFAAQESRGLAQLAKLLSGRDLGFEDPPVVAALLACARALGCRTVLPHARTLAAKGEPGRRAREDCVGRIRAWAR